MYICIKIRTYIYIYIYITVYTVIYTVILLSLYDEVI